MANLSDASGWQEVAGHRESISDQEVSRAPRVPWQIWIVVVMLALEGVGNLLMTPDQPAALYWLLAKCLFITGLLKRWVWVYCLFLAIALIHVVAFLPISPIASLLNLVLILLAGSARGFYVSALKK